MVDDFIPRKFIFSAIGLAIGRGCIRKMFLLGDAQEFLQWAAEAKMEGRQHLAATAGTVAGLLFGYESIPSEWIPKLADRERIRRCCEQLEGYCNSIVEEKGIGFACNAENRWI